MAETFDSTREIKREDNGKQSGGRDETFGGRGGTRRGEVADKEGEARSGTRAPPTVPFWGRPKNNGPSAGDRAAHCPLRPPFSPLAPPPGTTQTAPRPISNQTAGRAEGRSIYQDCIIISVAHVYIYISKLANHCRCESLAPGTLLVSLLGKDPTDRALFTILYESL